MYRTKEIKMEKNNEDSDFIEFRKTLEDDILRVYGPILTDGELQRALGYRSMDAMRQSIKREAFPVPLYEIKGRRGRFAYAKDIANFLANIRKKDYESE